MTSSLDPDQTHCFVGADMGPKCGQTTLAANKFNNNAMVK